MITKQVTSLTKDKQSAITTLLENIDYQWDAAAHMLKKADNSRDLLASINRLYALVMLLIDSSLYSSADIDKITNIYNGYRDLYNEKMREI